ncbi:MAG: efflux RND transporter periplasmic adaptor subunit [Flavobacteriaceae bacterium]|nr:efflux RND transporter periplasmic adaptor subunit [Flavobacteriaceae bacterium]
MKNYIYKISLTITLTFLVSCGKEQQKQVAKNSAIINVQVAKVVTNKKDSFLVVSGKIQAAKSADLSTRIMGYVKKVHVKVGDKVQKNQLLITINNADLQAKKAQVDAEVLKATVAFNNVKKNYSRFKNLFESKSITQKEMDDMTANYKIAKASLEAANQMKNEIKAQFTYSNITAPFSGVITSKNITEGDMANPSKPLISLENPNVFEVITMIPETEINQIKNGTTVNVLVKSINKNVKGKVTEVSTSAKKSGGQYIVKIALEATEVAILSGMFTSVQFPVQKKTASNVVLIPTKAVVKNGQLSGIYTVSQSNTALLRWLRLGKAYGNQIEVLSGLSANEYYIISAEGKLFNGAKISIK